MKTTFPLIAFALMSPMVLASHRESPNSASMQQQPKTGVESLPAAIRRLKPGMGCAAINRTLGVGTFVKPIRPNATGSCKVLQEFQEGYTLTVWYDYDPSSIRLKWATLSRGDKIIAEMKK